MTAAAEITTHTAEQTEAIGAGIAVLLVAGDIVLLRGDLGAGKTTLVRGAARALGDFGDLQLVGTLGGVEMGLRAAGIPHKEGGVQAALAYLTGN